MCQRCQSMSASFGQGENVGASAYGGPTRPIELLVLSAFSPIKFHQCSTMNFTTVSIENIELKTKNVMSIPYITIFSSYEATIRSKNHPHCISQILYMAILHSRRFYTTSSPFHQPTFLYFLPLQPSSVPFHLYTYQHDLA